MAKIRGVDLSHWQANIDFSKLADNDIKFAIFKAGEIPTTSRNEYTDELYGRNITESKIHHIISGAYYFFHPSIGAARQARHFDAVMQKFGKPDLPPVIDVEVEDKMKPDAIADELKAMSDALISRGYRIPIIYSRWGFLVNQVGEPYWIKNHLLWLAQYSNTLINKPADMRNVIMWQFTDKLKLPGIGVALDGNYWLKTEEELLGLVKQPEPIIISTPVPTIEPPKPQMQVEFPNLEQETAIEEAPLDFAQETPEEMPVEQPQQSVEPPSEQIPERSAEFSTDEMPEEQFESENTAKPQSAIFAMLMKLIYALFRIR